MQKLVVEYEKFQRERLPVCSQDQGHLVETSCTIMDLKNVGVSQFWKVNALHILALREQIRSKIAEHLRLPFSHRTIRSRIT